MKRLSENKRKYYLLYTIVFLICCSGCFFVYYSAGKSFIYNGDGWSQHYKAYIYYSEYLKQIFRNIFIDHKLLIPQYDFSIGEGGDILGSFHYYVIGDLFALFTGLIPRQYIYIYYHVAVILRLYFSGIFFSWICFYKKIRNEYGIMGGALAYVFCFWALFNSVRHVYFLNVLMNFPLLIYGVEKIIEERKPYTFVFAVFISCISNFYFFYNIVLLTVIYVAIRLLVLYKTDIRKIGATVLQIFKYALLGVLSGSFIFIPVFYVFLQDSRISIEFGRHLTYPLSYYKKLPSMFFSTGREYWLCMGYASPVFLAMIVTFRKWRNNTLLCLLNLLAFSMVLFPFFGQIMNGFSYISNKWCFALALLAAYDLAFQWDNIKGNRLLLLIINIASALGLYLAGANSSILIPMTFSLIFILITFINGKERVRNILMVLIVALCIFYNADHQYSSRGTNYSETATTYEEDRNIFQFSEAYELSEFEEDEFYRYSGNHLEQNAAVLFNTHSTDYYWSLGNPYLSEYRNLMEIDEYLLQKYYEYGQRSTLYTLANVRYYVTDKGYEGMLPSGFEYYRSTDHYDLYMNKNALPFGYTYTNVIGYSDWMDLNIVEKETALAKAIVLADRQSDPLDLTSEKIEYRLVSNDNISLNDHEFKVSKAASDIQMAFETEGEIYLEIKGLKYDDGKKWLNGKTTNSSITITGSNGQIRTIDIFTNDDRYYNGRDSFTVDMGIFASDTNCLTLEFEEKGKYEYSQINLFVKEKDDSYLADLKEDTLEDVIFETNRITGTVDLKEDKYMLFSIPYSKGWKAFVDGKETELLNANIAYTALHLETGSHTIELRYETPFLKLGCAVTAISILLIILDLRLRKKKNNE